MVGLMLDCPGEQPVGFDNESGSIELLEGRFDFNRAAHFAANPLDTEAALIVEFLLLAEFETSVQTGVDCDRYLKILFE